MREVVMFEDVIWHVIRLGELSLIWFSLIGIQSMDTSLISRWCVADQKHYQCYAIDIALVNLSQSRSLSLISSIFSIKRFKKSSHSLAEDLTHIVILDTSLAHNKLEMRWELSL